MLKSERANDLCGVFFMVRRYVMFVLNNNDAYFVIIEIYCCGKPNNFKIFEIK
jgi:hypothetical protein